jgi:hypothetical protein
MNIHSPDIGIALDADIGSIIDGWETSLGVGGWIGN